MAKEHGNAALTDSNKGGAPLAQVSDEARPLSGLLRPERKKDAAMSDSNEKSVILIVDDDAESREVLSELLAKEGYTAVCAENGRDALDYLSRSKTVPDHSRSDDAHNERLGIPRAATRRSQIETMRPSLPQSDFFGLNGAV